MVQFALNESAIEDEPRLILNLYNISPATTYSTIKYVFGKVKFTVDMQD